MQTALIRSGAADFDSENAVSQWSPLHGLGSGFSVRRSGDALAEVLQPYGSTSRDGAVLFTPQRAKALFLKVMGA